MAVGTRVAAAALEVVRRLDTPAALASALGAIVDGDLTPHHSSPSDHASPTEDCSPADKLLPMYAPGVQSACSQTRLDPCWSAACDLPFVAVAAEAAAFSGSRSSPLD